MRDLSQKRAFPIYFHLLFFQQFYSHSGEAEKNFSLFSETNKIVAENIASIIWASFVPI